MKNEIPPKALKTMALLRSAGARDVLIVGGFVRDSLLGIQSKDVDIEVYGMSVDAIIAALTPHFSLDVVGKSFGVIKIDNELDVSVPRRESKIGMGHRDFKIDPDPDMSIEDAARRRDFTINSMAMREDGVVIDLFAGSSHLLKNNTLVATSDAFKEDSLRILRGMQFAARFKLRLGMRHTLDMAKEMFSDFQFLPKERIWEEWKKFAIKGNGAYEGFQILVETDWIFHFPELAAMREVPQDPEWHPEGCVWTHTVMVVQEAIEIALREQLDDNSRMILFFAALCHDMGKPDTTKMEGGRWRAKGHCEEGVAHTESFLNRIGAPVWLIDNVKPLVMEHLVHSAGEPTERAVRRLGRRLHPTNIHMLSLLIEADHSGRSPLPKGNPFTAWTAMADRLDLTTSQPMPILRGRDLIEIGIKPGKDMGSILNQAFEAQLDGAFDSVDGAIAWYRSQQNKLTTL